MSKTDDSDFSDEHVPYVTAPFVGFG